MEKTLGKEYANPVQRIAFLKDNCDSVEEKGYMKPFTPEQIQQKKEGLAETSIKIHDIEVEKKEAMRGFKSSLTPLQETKKEILQDIKNKARYAKEICFKFVDNDDKMVGFYNEEGNLIEFRPATSDEMQATIFQISRKTGTNK